MLNRLILKVTKFQLPPPKRQKHFGGHHAPPPLMSNRVNNPELTVFLTFKMTNIASGNQAFVNSLIGNTTGKITATLITFYRTYSGLGLLISKVHVGSYVAIANDSSSSFQPDLKFSSLKSNCTDLNKWHVISVTWSNKGENLSNC